MIDEEEIAVFWVVKELGTPTQQEILKRYRDHFDKDPSDLQLILSRWVDRFMLDRKGDRFKARQPRRMFRGGMMMDGLVPLSPEIDAETLERIRRPFEE